MLVAPVADGSVGTPSLFDVVEDKKAKTRSAMRSPARHLKLLAVERSKGDLLWLRYVMKRDTAREMTAA